MLKKLLGVLIDSCALMPGAWVSSSVMIDPSCRRAS
jgi:hypothetical protein